jgi:hypothetical protein
MRGLMVALVPEERVEVGELDFAEVNVEAIHRRAAGSGQRPDSTYPPDSVQ